MTDLETITETKWDVSTCHCAECQQMRDVWEPVHGVTGWLVFIALSFYPLVRWVLVPVSVAVLGEW